MLSEALLHNRKWVSIIIAAMLAIVFVTFIAAGLKALTLDHVIGKWISLNSDDPILLSCSKILDPIPQNAESLAFFGTPNADLSCPGSSNSQSGFGFDGVDGLLHFEPGIPFPLGYFTHYNRGVKGNTADISNVYADLEVYLALSDPVLETSFRYMIKLEETTNSLPNCPFPLPNQSLCPDRVSFINSIPDQVFLIGGIQYTLQIVGFIPVANKGSTCTYDSPNVRQEFITAEQAENNACLFARVIVKNPTLSITTIPNLSTTTLGATIHYTITIANIGNTKLNSVIVNNPALNIVNQNIGDLDIGAVRQLTRSYGPITTDDLAGVANTTTATATTPEGVAVGPFTGPSSVPVAALTLSKTVYLGQNGGASCPGNDFTYAEAGAPVTYCFAVTNIGSTNLANVTVTDNDLGFSLGQTGILSPSNSITLHRAATVSRDLLNTAQTTATVVDATGAPIPRATAPTTSDIAEVKLLAVKELQPSAATLDVNTTHIVTVDVVDSFDAPFSTLPVNFVVRGANNASGAVLPINGRAIFSYSGTITGTDIITAWIDLDGDIGITPENIDPGEPRQNATAIWKTVYTITQTQTTSETFIGLQHTVTAVVTNHLQELVSGIDVCFAITGVHPLIRCDKSENGIATLTYDGVVTGTDLISAWVDLSNPGVQDPHEPNDQVSLAWLSIAIATEPIGQKQLNIGSQNHVSLTVVSARDGSTPVRGLLVNFSVAGTNLYQDMQQTDASGRVMFKYIGMNNVVTAIAPLVDNIVVWIDLDKNKAPNGNEPQTTLNTGWLPIAVAVKGTGLGTEAAATRTITVTVENSQQQRVEQLDVDIGFSVAGGTVVPTTTTRFSDGQVVFTYTSVAPSTTAVQATSAIATPAEQKQIDVMQVCDRITIWVDLDNDRQFDPGTPQLAAEPMYSECVKTAIRLIHFSGQSYNNGVVRLAWATATEIDNAGFNLYRASFKEGPYTLINPRLIAAQGDNLGAEYEYVDEFSGILPVYYKLEDIDYSGVGTIHGPIRVPLLLSEDELAAVKLYLPLIQQR